MSTAPLRSILVATDVSAGSDEVVRAAAALAALSGGRLHVLHAFGFSDPSTNPDAPVPATFGGLIAETRRIMEQQIQGAAPRGSEYTSLQVAIRTPSKAILENAQSVAADLVVMGTHRTHRFGDALLGSTADRVVRKSAVPCLLVQGRFSLPLRKILVADDLSGPSRGALEVALSWAVAFGVGSEPGLPEVEVDVVHVITGDLATADIPFQSAVIGPELGREVQEAVSRTDGANQLDVREVVIWGDDPVQKIVEFAEKGQASLIVLGTHGRSAVQRALLGSVTSAVAQHASTPVLLVPPSVWREVMDADHARGRLESQRTG